jgi:hypothetical protein
VNYDKYKNKVSYPKENAFARYIIYSQGTTLLDTKYVAKAEKFLDCQPGEIISQRAFAKRLENKKLLGEYILYNDKYQAAIKKYRQGENAAEELFKQDLFAEHGVENNPKRDMCYTIAYQKGHSAGYSEIASEFGDIVCLIQD